MFSKIAAAIALIVAALTAPIIAQPDSGPAGYPAPASETAPAAYEVGAAPEIAPPTATPVMLHCTIWLGAACASITWTPAALSGTPAPCDIWYESGGVIYCAANLTPAATPQPKGYPAP